MFAGNSVCRAVEELLSRGVIQDQILYLCLIAAPAGLHRLCSQYPKLKVITSEIETGLDDKYNVIPGIGQFGDRCDFATATVQ